MTPGSRTPWDFAPAIPCFVCKPRLKQEQLLHCKDAYMGTQSFCVIENYFYFCRIFICKSLYFNKMDELCGIINDILIFAGYFDWLIIFTLIFLNIKFWNSDKYISSCWFFPVFGFILPIISITIEFEINGPQKGESFDSFTMLYVYFRFPLYWILCFVQYFILKIRG